MHRAIQVPFVILVAIAFVACQGGAANVPTQGFNTQQDSVQGQGQEGNTNTNHANPIVILGGKKVRVGPDGTIDVEGADDQQVIVNGSVVSYGEDSLKQEASSGGGALAGSKGVGDVNAGRNAGDGKTPPPDSGDGG